MKYLKALSFRTKVIVSLILLALFAYLLSLFLRLA